MSVTLTTRRGTWFRLILAFLGVSALSRDASADVINPVFLANTPFVWSASLDDTLLGPDGILFVGPFWEVIALQDDFDFGGVANDIIVAALHLVGPHGGGELAPNPARPVTALQNVIPGGAAGPAVASVAHFPLHANNLVISYVAAGPGVSQLLIDVDHTAFAMQPTSLPFPVFDPFDRPPPPRIIEVPATVPEPGTLALFAIGLASGAVKLRTRRRIKEA